MLPPSGQISKLCRTYSRRGAANNNCERLWKKATAGGYRAMAQSVSHRHITSEVRVRSQATPCGIYGGRSGWTGSLPRRSDYFDFSCQYHSSNAPYISLCTNYLSALCSHTLPLFEATHHPPPIAVCKSCSPNVSTLLATTPRAPPSHVLMPP
jgi:hypothetical protein